MGIRRRIVIFMRRSKMDKGQRIQLVVLDIRAQELVCMVMSIKVYTISGNNSSVRNLNTIAKAAN